MRQKCSSLRAIIEREEPSNHRKVFVLRIVLSSASVPYGAGVALHYEAGIVRRGAAPQNDRMSGVEAGRKVEAQGGGFGEILDERSGQRARFMDVFERLDFGVGGDESFKRRGRLKMRQS